MGGSPSDCPKIQCGALPSNGWLLLPHRPGSASLHSPASFDRAAFISPAQVNSIKQLQDEQQPLTPRQENIGRLTKCVEGGKDVQACALGDFDRLQQLVKGMYSLFLPAWLASYPPSHLLVLNFDDYRWVLPPL